MADGMDSCPTVWDRLAVANGEIDRLKREHAAMAELLGRLVAIKSLAASDQTVVAICERIAVTADKLLCDIKGGEI